MHNMSGVAQVVAPSIGVSDALPAVRLEPPILPSAPQGGDQVREPKIGTGLNVAWHNSKPSNTPSSANYVCLDGEVILGFSGALRIPATLANRHFAPVRTALVVVLVKGSGSVWVVHVATEG